MPPRLVQNDESWLAFTDLVFVDPVGTGFSRVIEQTTTKDGDEGEQEATTRPTRRSTSATSATSSRSASSWAAGSRATAAGARRSSSRARATAATASAASCACSRRAPGIGLNGAILISPALEIATLAPTDYDVARVGRHAADDGRRGGASRPLARVRGRHARSTTSCARPRRSRRATTPSFLTRGASMARRRARADPRAGSPTSSGFPLDLVARAEGRISIRTFTRELLRDERKVLGLYDATITVTDPFPDRDSFAGPDPTLSGISPAYTMAINRQLRSEIGVETDREYTVLSLEVNEAWKERRRPALLRPAGRRDRRLPLRHGAQPAHEGVHHARAVRPRHAVLRERPAAEPDAARPGDGGPPDRPALRRRPHVLRVGGRAGGTFTAAIAAFVADAT